MKEAMLSTYDGHEGSHCYVSEISPPNNKESRDEWIKIGYLHLPDGLFLVSAASVKVNLERRCMANIISQNCSLALVV
jgi:hypothetical protein